MNERSDIRGFLERLLQQTGDRRQFSDSDPLVTSGRLASIDVLDVVAFLEDRYGIDFAERGFDQNELDSVDGIVALVHAK